MKPQLPETFVLLLLSHGILATSVVGWPAADHRRTPQFSQTLPPELRDQPRDSSGRDIPNPSFLPSIFPDRDVPADQDRRIPDSFFQNFALLPNPEQQQPDSMRDYALLDEGEYPKAPPPTTIIALPPIPFRNDRITKLPVVTSTLEVLAPTVPATRPTPTGRKTNRGSTGAPRVKNTRGFPGSTTTSRKPFPTPATKSQPRIQKSAAAKPTMRRQNDTRRSNVQQRSVASLQKEHRGQKRSPQQQEQELSYIPAFRRQQNSGNRFNGAPKQGFANSDNARFGGQQPVQNNPYHFSGNRRAADRNSFQTGGPYVTRPATDRNSFQTGGPYVARPATDRSSFQLGPYDNLAGYNPYGGYDPSFALNHLGLNYGGNPHHGYNLGFSGYNLPLVGYNGGLSGYGTPFPGYGGFQNPLLTFRGPVQTPAFFGGAFAGGLPNFVFAYQIPAPVPLPHPGFLQTPFFGGAGGPVYNSFGYPGFGFDHHDPRDHPLYEDLLDRNDTGHRGGQSYEIDSLNGVQRPPRRKNANRMLRPDAGIAPLGPEPPSPFFRGMMRDAPRTLGMNNSPAMGPMRPFENNGYQELELPDDYPHFDEDDGFDFPEQTKRPDLDDDDDDFDPRPKPKEVGFGSSTKSETTTSTMAPMVNDSFGMEEDAQRFRPLTATTTGGMSEKPNAETSSDRGGSDNKGSTLQQETPQKNATEGPSPADGQQEVPKPLTLTVAPPATAQDRFSNDDSPFQTLYYRGHHLADNPTMLAYFYPRKDLSPGEAPPPGPAHYGISINDPQLLNYFRVNTEAPVSTPAPKRKPRGRKPRPSLSQECTDLFGTKGRCKTSKSKRKKPKSKSKQTTPLPFEVLDGGLFLNFGEDVPFDGPQLQGFPEGQAQVQVPDANRKQMHTFDAPLFYGSTPARYPQPPPNTVPLAQMEPFLLAQGDQGSWRPLTRPPFPSRTRRPMYNRQHFRAKPPPVSPHSHPATWNRIRFPNKAN